MSKLSVLPSNCDCEKCSNMCKGPCCGTPGDFQRLMNAGYGSRLMLDDWPDGEPMLKPALKGHEGQIAPYETRTEEGCTFWYDGKCQLHDLGLKPTQGKLTHHSLTIEQQLEIADMIDEKWQIDDATHVIEQWQKNYQTME